VIGNCLSQELIDLYYKSLSTADPCVLIKNCLSMDSNNIETPSFKLPIKRKINLLAFGKASIHMYNATRRIVAEERLGRCVIVTHDTKKKINCKLPTEELVYSTHPVVSPLSFIAGEKVLRFVEEQHHLDTLLVLVSGGGSAMVAMPVNGLSPEAKTSFINQVFLRGVPEREVNVLRKALSSIKGGKLAQRSRASTLVNLILSDEREHKLSAISSGMTICGEALNPVAIMDRYDLWGCCSEQVSTILRQHNRDESICTKSVTHNHIVGSRNNLIEALTMIARQSGYKSIKVIKNLHSITAEQATKILWRHYRRLIATSEVGKHLIIGTGELQINSAHGGGGLGGRNQHLAALMMREAPELDENFAFTALATDGVDYLDGVHGAFFDNSFISKIRHLRAEIDRELIARNTYSIHKLLGTLILGEKTGTNLSDFYLFSFIKNT